LGALLGEAGLAGEIGGGRAGLAEDVQVAVLAARSAPDLENLLRAHREGLRGSGHLLLFLLISSPLPGDQDSAVLQERRGELGEGRKAAYGVDA
jgi:hypothetical protein